MRLREYCSSDCATLATLFFDTVHTVNAKDYTEDQLKAWAPVELDLTSWDKSFQKNNCIIAESDGIIVGFGDMEANGYLDRLYVHHSYQGQGVATAILAKLEGDAVAMNLKHFSFSTYASITAIPFFQAMGYNLVHENTVVRNNIILINFLMEKAYSPNK